MKKIYSFTLSSDEYPSSSRNLAEDLRLIAHMVYSEIYSYYDEDQIVLNINKNIEYNRLCDDCFGHMYRFDSDIYDDGYIYYEPFIVGKNTFCLTLADMSFDDEKIMQILDYVLKLLKLNYTVSVDTTLYDAKDIDDERYRDVAIKSIFDKLGYAYDRKNRLIYTIISGVCNKRRSRNVNRKCFGYY